jgi:hypothetical protein
MTDDRWLCEQNIALLRSQLEFVLDDERRKRILVLLAEEQVKLDRLVQPRKSL